MSLSRVVACIALTAAFLPAPATAGVKLVARGEPVHAARSVRGDAEVVLRTRPAPMRFNMVGLHWTGPGTVWFRTALEPGIWSEWRQARPEAEDGPDADHPEADARRSWKLGNPYWTGPARYIEYRLAGDVWRLRAHFLWSEPSDDAAVSVRSATRPAIIRRSAWGADESIVRAPPWYADGLRLAIVHHTAGTNDYRASESAAIVRGIQRYHVLANGWNDIGYNFLVDKYGQVFEGRAGGIDLPVGGAHAQGFNTGSTGIAVLGTYSTRDITRAARSALVDLISWRLDVAHVDPLTNLTYVSYGSNRFPAGTSVRLRAVSGHRDTSFTSCPGNILYGRLGDIAKAAAARGLPKLYEPAVTGGLGGPVRITARLSSALPWAVTIRDGAGAEVARGTGTGTAVDWTWDASAVVFGDYFYEITAGPDVRPASGKVPGPPKLVVSNLKVRPRALTPNGDGVGEATKISFELTTSATVTASIRDAGGTTVAAPVRDRAIATGPFSFRWKGMRSDGSPAPDARYKVHIDARSPGQVASASRTVIVDRTLGFLTVLPAAFSPNGDGRLDATTAAFELTRPADVRLTVRADGEIVEELMARSLVAGTPAVAWDGLAAGARVPDDTYRVAVYATTTLGTRRLGTAVTVDTTRPVVKVLSARLRDGVTTVRFLLNEWAAVRIRLGDRVVHLERDAGTYTVRRRVRAETVGVQATDRAGNIRRTGAVPVS